MGLDYWKRGKLCIECKNFKSNIKYCIFDCSRVAAGPELWAKYFLQTLISPQICWPHVSRVSKVHRLPDLRSVYPRSSGNNNNLNQPVLGEVWGCELWHSDDWYRYLGWGSCSATHEVKSWIQNSPAIFTCWLDNTTGGPSSHWLADCGTQHNRSET